MEGSLPGAGGHINLILGSMQTTGANPHAIEVPTDFSFACSPDMLPGTLVYQVSLTVFKSFRSVSPIIDSLRMDWIF